MPAEPVVGVAAFDFDGTLIRGASMGPFLMEALGWRSGATKMLAAGPAMIGAYRRAGRGGAKEELLNRVLAGFPIVEAEAAGRRFGARLATRVRPSMAERVAWHRRQGHRLVIVSASLELYLVATAAALRFDGVLATRLEEGEDRRLTGRLLGENCRGAEKETRLRGWLADHLGEQSYRLWAYGDSHGDDELLAMADTAIRI